MPCWTPPADDGRQPVDFLARLFGNPFPDGTRIALWRKSDKTSIYLDSPDQAAEHEGATDVYVSAGLAPAGLSIHERLKAAQCLGISRLWMDVDVNGGPENKQDAAPDRKTARDLCHAVHPPTIVVSSGYGYQAWWSLPEPWIFTDDQDRQRAARLMEAWQMLHREHAEQMGFKLDSTHDLARLMRLVGTINGKGGLQASVEIVELNETTCAIDQAEQLAAKQIAKLAAAETTGQIAGQADLVAELAETNGNVDLPRDKFDALIREHDNFRKSWEGLRKDLADDTLHPIDLSLCSIAAHAGWDDGELVALIKHNRAEHGNAAAIEKGNRPDYQARTIRKARESTDNIADLTDPLLQREALTKELGITQLGQGDIAVKETEIHGSGSTAIAIVRLTNDRELTFDPYDDVGKNANLSRFLMRHGIVRRAKQIDAIGAGVLIHKLALHHEQDVDDTDAREWGTEFLRLARPLHFDFTDQTSKWGAFDQSRSDQPDGQPEGQPERRTQRDHARATVPRARRQRDRHPVRAHRMVLALRQTRHRPHRPGEAPRQDESRRLAATRQRRRRPNQGDLPRQPQRHAQLGLLHRPQRLEPPMSPGNAPWKPGKTGQVTRSNPLYSRVLRDFRRLARTRDARTRTQRVTARYLRHTERPQPTTQETAA